MVFPEPAPAAAAAMPLLPPLAPTATAPPIVSATIVAASTADTSTLPPADTAELSRNASTSFSMSLRAMATPTEPAPAWPNLSPPTATETPPPLAVIVDVSAALRVTPPLVPPRTVLPVMYDLTLLVTVLPTPAPAAPTP